MLWHWLLTSALLCTFASPSASMPSNFNNCLMSNSVKTTNSLFSTVVPPFTVASKATTYKIKQPKSASMIKDQMVVGDKQNHLFQELINFCFDFSDSFTCLWYLITSSRLFKLPLFACHFLQEQQLWSILHPYLLQTLLIIYLLSPEQESLVLGLQTSFLDKTLLQIPFHYKNHKQICINFNEYKT